LSDKRAVLFVNAHSRRGAQWFREAEALLFRGGLKLEAAELIKKSHEMQRQVKAAVADGIPLIVCGGGDGTFNSVARLLSTSSSVLGVLPFGTGNAFARDLGIETNIEHACKTILGGNIVQVDLGLVNDEPFLNMVSIGLTTLIVRNLTKESKSILGPGAYMIALARAIAVAKPFRVSIGTDNNSESFETFQVVIGNGRFHAGPFPVAPDAGIQTGKLALYALRSSNKWSLLTLGWSLSRGMDVDLSQVYSISANGGTVSTVPQKAVTVDGEVNARTPISFGMKSGALRVMAPPLSEGEHLAPACTNYPRVK